MIRQPLAFGLILIASITALLGAGRLVSSAQHEQCSRGHEAWVGQVLQEMETVKTGMTRAELLRIFTTEGGLSTGLNRRFVSRDCPYFKVVMSNLGPWAGQIETATIRVTLVEDPRDVIVKISQPFLEYSIKD